MVFFCSVLGCHLRHTAEPKKELFCFGNAKHQPNRQQICLLLYAQTFCRRANKEQAEKYSSMYTYTHTERWWCASLYSVSVHGNSVPKMKKKHISFFLRSLFHLMPSIRYPMAKHFFFFSLSLCFQWLFLMFVFGCRCSRCCCCCRIFFCFFFVFFLSLIFWAVCSWRYFNF